MRKSPGLSLKTFRDVPFRNCSSECFSVYCRSPPTVNGNIRPCHQVYCYKPHLNWFTFNLSFLSTQVIFWGMVELKSVRNRYLSKMNRCLTSSSSILTQQKSNFVQNCEQIAEKKHSNTGYFSPTYGRRVSSNASKGESAEKQRNNLCSGIQKGSFSVQSQSTCSFRSSSTPAGRESLSTWGDCECV